MKRTVELVWSGGLCIGRVVHEEDGTWTATGLDAVAVYRCPTRKVAVSLVERAAVTS